MSAPKISKFQATIPKRIKKKLDIKTKNFKFKIVSDDIAYLKMVEITLSEWNTKEDDEAFAHLQNI